MYYPDQNDSFWKCVRWVLYIFIALAMVVIFMQSGCAMTGTETQMYTAQKSDILTENELRRILGDIRNNQRDINELRGDIRSLILHLKSREIIQ